MASSRRMIGTEGKGFGTLAPSSLSPGLLAATKWAVPITHPTLPWYSALPWTKMFETRSQDVFISQMIFSPLGNWSLLGNQNNMNQKCGKIRPESIRSHVAEWVVLEIQCHHKTNKQQQRKPLRRSKFKAKGTEVSRERRQTSPLKRMT